ncbi:MAG: tRNA lysidine(34) synthetase TilS [Paenirhodobacter sp.]|uniref:tRNA lysidine(34) synthetase TilS n=1 Tax=Paenirhodobacter sp. TaxID=1965326 RepID=UPI003D0F9493
MPKDPSTRAFMARVDALFGAVGNDRAARDDALLVGLGDAALMVARLREGAGFGPVAVAVSGGSDSMAALHALHETMPVIAVTVDHGLRPEAAEEAHFVAQAAARLGIGHEILRWQRSETHGNLMDQARRARQALIADWARGRGIRHVVLGHTADDEAESFVMRLARSSGLSGLSGMRKTWVAEGVHWYRPFLRLSRAQLRGYLQRRGIGWIEDPSNEDSRFERVRVRQALALLEPLGVTRAVIAQVVENLGEAEETLRHVLRAEVGSVVLEDRGDLVLDLGTGLDRLQGELMRMFLDAALRWVSRQDYGPRAEKLIDLWHDLPELRQRTLHGCLISRRGDSLRITREAKAVAGLRVPLGQVWDRWALEGPAEPGLEIAALGAGGLVQVKDWRESGLPRASLFASPAVWRGEALIAAPLAGLENGWKARIDRGAFAASLIRR